MEFEMKGESVKKKKRRRKEEERVGEEKEIWTSRRTTESGLEKRRREEKRRVNRPPVNSIELSFVWSGLFLFVLLGYFLVS